MRATRRNALRGAGLAGMLALGSGSATASQDSSGANTHQDKDEMSANDDTVPVTWENFPRAQFHVQMESYVEWGGFGELYHYRTLLPLDEQTEAASNRDTLYSPGFFDLTEPVTITKPDTGDRYQSMVASTRTSTSRWSNTSLASAR